MDYERLEVFLSTLADDNGEYIEGLREKALADDVPIIRRTSERLIKFIINTYQPKTILEIGTAVGYSAIFMASISNAHITTIEKYPPRITEAKKNFKECGYGERITFLTGDAIEILKELDGSYDMIFMDAAKGQYQVFLEDSLRLLDKNGILVCDNVLQEGDVLESRYGVKRRDRSIHSRMRDFLYDITHDEKLVSTIIPLGDGMSLTTYKK